MTKSMRDSLTDLQADINSLQGDVVWMRALVKRAKGEVRLQNLHRANRALQAHADSLQMQAQGLVDAYEGKHA